MAASVTVPQLPSLDNFRGSTPLTPHRGVITLYGYGIRVQVQRGHLHLEDGIGAARRGARLARVGHGLRRLVVIGSDGVVSLAALRWLADQKAAFVMLDRDGTVLAVTGPARPSDVRLRRAQALAHQSDMATTIARDLVTHKLSEQQDVVVSVLRNAAAGEAIAVFRGELGTATTLDEIRRLEAHAAIAYWGAWRGLEIPFPRHQLARVPAHWRLFSTRGSPLSEGPRLAIDPINAILNYLYAILETEARLAAAALGLDPGLGFLHADTISRDNLACDLMEPVRPAVDAYVLKWIRSQTLRREWFFETSSGNCRLMAALAEQLTQTAATWARAVAPVAERVAKTLWTTRDRRSARNAMPTVLTQSHRRIAQGVTEASPSVSPPSPPKVCQICGTPLASGAYCRDCAVIAATENLIVAAQKGRIMSKGLASQAKRAAARVRNAGAERAWRPSDLPTWLTEDYYDQQVRPRLMELTNKAIRSAINVSVVWAIRIRHGSVRPHPRHWQKLAQLAELPSSRKESTSPG